MPTAARRLRLGRPLLPSARVRPTYPGLLSRRQALGTIVVGVAGVASGCGPVEPDSAVPAVAIDPLETLVREKQSLLDQYLATIAAHPGLTAALGPLRDAHREHRDALLELLDARRRAALARATPPVPGPDNTPSAGSVRPDESAALVALRAAERTATARSRVACLAVTAGDVASTSERVTVLGSISAAEASHLVALS